MRILLVMLLAAMQAATPPPDAPTATIDNGQVRASSTCPTPRPATTAARGSTGRARFEPDLERPRVLRPVVRALRSDAARRHPGPGRGVPDRRQRARLRRGGARRHLRPHRRRRAAQAGRRDVAAAVRPLRDRRPRDVDDEGGQGSHRVRPRAEGRHGYAYAYRKALRLDGDSLILEHELANTGTKPIATSVYNHNFFMLDRKTTGPDIVVRFPFAPKAARPLNGMAEIRGREIAFLRAASAEGERLHRDRGLRGHAVRQRLRDGEPRHRRRRPRRPAIGRCRSCCSGRRSRRPARSRTSTPASRPAHDDVAHDLHVLPGEEEPPRRRRRAAARSRVSGSR